MLYADAVFVLFFVLLAVNSDTGSLRHSKGIGPSLLNAGMLEWNDPEMT